MVSGRVMVPGGPPLLSACEAARVPRPSRLLVDASFFKNTARPAMGAIKEAPMKAKSYAGDYLARMAEYVPEKLEKSPK
jgi:hypothetical protein